jgi:hypothetical protein
MGKLEIDLDDETLAKAKDVATSRDTTLDEMVQEFVRSVARQTPIDREKAVELLRESFQRLSRNMGPRTWKRDDLYDRYECSLIQPPLPVRRERAGVRVPI